jgi:hypothetical protein
MFGPGVTAVPIPADQLKSIGMQLKQLEVLPILQI